MAMADCRTYTYEVMKTVLDTNQEVLVQIFRDTDTLKILHAQIAFRNASSGSWGVPYQLEVAQ
jgi:hypothetical protein